MSPNIRFMFCTACPAAPFTRLSIALTTTARFVFPLGRWSLESGDRDFLIANLVTNDGFRVSFAVPFDACKAIGWSLFREGQSALQERDKSPSGEPATVN